MKKYDAINAQLFIDNRKKLIEKLLAGTIAIIQANDEMPRSADGTFPFRQNSDLFWLTGIDQEETILVLFPEHPDPEQREILFVRRTNEHIAVWEGHKYTEEEARATSGIANVKWADSFDSILPSLMYLAQNCCLNMNEHTRMSNQVPDRDLRFARHIRKQFPLHQYTRLAPMMHQLRAIKSELEIALIQHACNITEKAFRRVLAFVKPNVHEYEVEAEIMHEFLRNRATGPAYGSIIASGKNACVLHYVNNNQPCNDGDLLLMDFGAEYANYAADLTRTIPVNGRFTARQRAVYDAVLRVMKQATDLLRPGVMIDEYHKEVGKFMESELIGLGLLNATDVAKQNPKAPLYKKYFPHGTSHFLGLDVHDVGHRYSPIQAGMVFTCEPGIYIPEEGIGIRLENDILVTNDDPIDLMKNIPLEADEIEALMN
jgi:Xaa-Pro aminopeptidase